MQTVKTAAIVVLLMTGLYGTYVSLTTPPEPLPEEVQDLLDFDTDLEFAIDTGLPESLGGFDQPEEAVSSSDMALNPEPSINGEAGAQPDISQPDQDATAEDQASQPLASITENIPQDLSPQRQTQSSDADFALTSGTTIDEEVPTADEMVQRADLATEVTTPNLGLTNALQTADRQFYGDKKRDALATLSIFYNAPNMTGEQRSELLSRLDPLAREVIYSKRHLLEQPHRVGQKETLIDIAASYQVPWQLLANINRIADPVTVLPGTELKVVRGPFRAEVNLATKEITLFLGDLYAGRFPVEIGMDPTPKVGTYTIQDKKADKIYYDQEGTPVPAGSPANPYGDVWMDLGSMLSIHGSPDPNTPTTEGCISLSSNLARDVYGILSRGSSVTIRR